MGNTIILTKHHPSELADIEKAEAYQVSMLGAATGDQIVQEQHGWWNEAKQQPEFPATTLKTEKRLPLNEAKEMYYGQIANRVQEGFVHSRSYSFIENKFVYRDLSDSVAQR